MIQDWPNATGEREESCMDNGLGRAIIAANRFGLGARPGELQEIAHDPKEWVLAQLEQPAPPDEALLGLPGSRSIWIASSSTAASVVRRDGRVNKQSCRSSASVSMAIFWPKSSFAPVSNVALPRRCMNGWSCSGATTSLSRPRSRPCDCLPVHLNERPFVRISMMTLPACCSVSSSILRCCCTWIT
ncbi:hypothetical protein A8U91_00146 [Halomonas elongata]|uniref:Uncharacterized protein n=1 Tax=Halomonas elongata TaxID=2746 RepID=A0A1B8P0P0_HALEL|nr:hypothetical protein A8U91_00146 [Halomonas elongata]